MTGEKQLKGKNIILANIEKFKNAKNKTVDVKEPTRALKNREAFLKTVSNDSDCDTVISKKEPISNQRNDNSKFGTKEFDFIMANWNFMRATPNEQKRMLIDKTLIFQYDITLVEDIFKYIKCGEIWKPMPDFEKYEISNMGNIRNIFTKRNHKLHIKNGYYYCYFTDNGKMRAFRVHRIIAKLFVENSDPELNTIVNHIDGNRLNNHYKNLEWTTIAGNNQHAADNNLTGKTKRRISQYKNDKLIKIFDTVVEAAASIDVNTGRIVEACKGRRDEIGGFEWRYTDVNENEQEVDLDNGEFKQLKTFPNYWINNKGQLYSEPFKKFMKAGPHKTGCLQIQLTKPNPKEKGQIKRTVLLHNIVAAYFMKKSNNTALNCIRHKDGNRQNNDVNNLEWCYVPGASPKYDM
jgi:hypothetical protein